MKYIYTFAILIYSFTVTIGQKVVTSESSYDIQIQEKLITIDKNIDAFEWGHMPAASKFRKGYFGWVQFSETPGQELQNEFKEKGLELIEYIPNKAYVFYFPDNTSLPYLKQCGVRAIVPIEAQYKLSTELNEVSYPSYAIDRENVLVMMKFHKHIDVTDIIEELKKQKVIVRQKFNGYPILEVSIPIESIITIANLPYVKWMELIPAPEELYDNRGRGLHRANNLDTQMPGGRNYTGEGVGVLVRDNGPIGELQGPHIDFQGRLVDFLTEGDPNLNFHSDAVAGIFTGAGNLDPAVRGMAPGATLYNVGLGSSFLDTATTNLINSGAVQITNTSSGFPCGNGYTMNAVTVDQQARDIPSLLHVLSAGNVSSTADCGYGAGPTWGTLGGANKTGKNMIAAANVRFDGSIVPSSARGPAQDGRIKPDLSAMGAGQVSTDENNGYFTFSGTSASSPAIAGVATQLYDAYSQMNGDSLPPSALIKAAMLNTTNEAGNIGPDFIYGWGLVNGLRAAKVIEDKTYLIDEIAQGETNNHVIKIPAGANQVRFMVYWSDVPGAIGANPALVNDIDLVVNDPEGNALLPWVLDPTPDPVALNTPATNGPDHLNNMEQVQINNPIAGDYNLDLSGFNIPMGPQEYFIVYEIIMDNINITYPNGGEHFVSGRTEVIHWDAINITEDYILEYSEDDGVNWTNIATVPSNTTNYVWTVPFLLKSTALVRISSGAFTDISDAAFSATPLVSGFQFSQVCPDAVTFEWNAMSDAESYDVYLLGEKYMEVAGTSTTTTITLPISDPTVTIWAAIVAKNDTENWASRRTVAINSSGLSNCPLDNDIAINEILNDVNGFSTPCNSLEDIIISVFISNTGTEPQSNFELSYQLNNEAIVTETYTETIMPGGVGLYDFATTLTIPGDDEYTLTATANLAGDQNIFNNEATLNFVSVSSVTELDFEEDFENNLMAPSGWSVINSDEALTWEFVDGIIGSDGTLTNVAFINNSIYEDEREQDFLVTEYFDLTDENSGTILSFDLAKAQWGSDLMDGLRIDVAIDCRNSYSVVYEKEDLELSTLPNYNTTSEWQPLTAADWRTEEIDLTPFEGEIIQIRFVSINGFGNSTYIDNVNVRAGSLVSTTEAIFSEITLYPNPADESVTIDLGSQSSVDAFAVITNNLGQISHQQALNNNSPTVINISNNTPGLYFVTITAEGVSTTKKLIIE